MMSCLGFAEDSPVARGRPVLGTGVAAESGTSPDYDDSDTRPTAQQVRWKLSRAPSGTSSEMNSIPSVLDHSFEPVIDRRTDMREE